MDERLRHVWGWLAWRTLLFTAPPCGVPTLRPTVLPESIFEDGHVSRCPCTVCSLRATARQPPERRPVSSGALARIGVTVGADPGPQNLSLG